MAKPKLDEEKVLGQADDEKEQARRKAHQDAASTQPSIVRKSVVGGGD